MKVEACAPCPILPKVSGMRQPEIVNSSLTSQDKIKLELGWKAVLKDEFQKPYMLKLKEFLKKEIDAGKKIYPRPSEIFNAFNHTPFEKVKVVILGQDPYHGEGQAHGLSFSVRPGV